MSLRAVSKRTGVELSALVLETPLLGGAYQLDEIAVDPKIVGDLGMERGGQYVLVTDSNNLGLIQTRWHHGA